MIRLAIKRLKTEQGVSTQQLADKMGVTVQAVGKWERGEGFPRAEQLPKLADLLGCSIDDLFDKTDERSETA